MKKGTRAFYWKIKDFLTDPNRKLNNVIAGRNGRLYEVRESTIGRIAYEKKEIKELDEISPGFQFFLPKIPGEILETALSFFRAYCNEFEQNEVMLIIYWDKLTKQYFLNCPEQKVSKAFIECEFDRQLQSEKVNPRFVKVCEFHSHNTMEAYFSTVDDQNETSFLLYGVAGLLQFFTPEVKLRAGVNGEFISLPLDYIFDRPCLHEIRQFPKEWHSKVIILNERESR
jgi:hypothetical protein